MFRELARWRQVANPNNPNSAGAVWVFDQHPATLARFLEEAWRNRAQNGFGTPMEPSLAYPDDMLRTDTNSYLDRDPGFQNLPYPATVPAQGTWGNLQWDHLIYAYMLENTRIYEIFARVLQEYLSGERLATPSAASLRWLRATEELFYRDAPPFAVSSMTSWLRPDIRAERRNAYYRMFGMDLNHGAADGKPYPYEKPPAVNRNFVGTFENFCREVWYGIENWLNTSGPNATDDAAIAALALSLRDMLRARRGRGLGSLAREEFSSVCAMSWCHLTIQHDESPIVVDLQAEASSPDERLRRIGERVGLPAHSRSRSYLLLAPALSRILRGIEAGNFDTAAGVPALYRLLPGNAANPVRDDMTIIITHWSAATGRDLKATRVAPTSRSAPAPNPSNGRLSIGSP